MTSKVKNLDVSVQNLEVMNRPTRKIKQKLNAKQDLLHMRHYRTTNIGRGFYALQPC